MWVNTCFSLFAMHTKIFDFVQWNRLVLGWALIWWLVALWGDRHRLYIRTLHKLGITCLGVCSESTQVDFASRYCAHRINLETVMTIIRAIHTKQHGHSPQWLQKALGTVDSTSECSHQYQRASSHTQDGCGTSQLHSPADQPKH